VINEVLAKPANDSTALAKTSDWNVITGSVEWLELVNKGSTEVREAPGRVAGGPSAASTT
jgi:hypothetical protein